MQTLIIEWQREAEANKLRQRPTAPIQELTEHIKLPFYELLVIQWHTQLAQMIKRLY